MTAISFVFRVIVLYVCYTQIGLYGAAWGNIVMAVISLVYWYLLMRREVGLEASGIIRHFREQVDYLKNILKTRLGRLAR
jgi:Na+-driven multidrug efflux pump